MPFTWLNKSRKQPRDKHMHIPAIQESKKFYLSSNRDKVLLNTLRNILRNVILN